MVEIPKFLEGAAFGILNDVLSGFHDDNGYAQPNRYEVLILPPAKLGGGNQTNIFSGLERQGDTRNISLRAQSVNLPGRNLATSQDTNIYGPEREVVEGVTYAEEMIDKNIRVNNEFYVCPVYNQAIEDGKKIRTFDIPKMWGLGTPEDLKNYLENYK